MYGNVCALLKKEVNLFFPNTMHFFAAEVFNSTQSWNEMEAISWSICVTNAESGSRLGNYLKYLSIFFILFLNQKCSFLFKKGEKKDLFYQTKGKKKEGIFYNHIRIWGCYKMLQFQN